jgi:hypothetical protein
MSTLSPPGGGAHRHNGNDFCHVNGGRLHQRRDAFRTDRALHMPRTGCASRRKYAGIQAANNSTVNSQPWSSRLTEFNGYGFPENGIPHTVRHAGAAENLSATVLLDIHVGGDGVIPFAGVRLNPRPRRIAAGPKTFHAAGEHSVGGRRNGSFRSAWPMRSPDSRSAGRRQRSSSSSPREWSSDSLRF